MAKRTTAPGSAEFKSALAVLKKVLKERGISYRDLAKQVGLSESGLKKIFLADDCSFRRLAEIAAALGMKITDVLQEVEQRPLEQVRFSPEAQEYFLSEPSAFNFYFKLVFERMTVEEVKRFSGWTEAQVFKQLRRLDELQLIKLLPGDRVKVPDLRVVRDFGTGPFLERLYQRWGQDIVRELAVSSRQGSGEFVVRSLKMKDETYEDFLYRLKELEHEFVRRAIREMAVQPGELKPVRWMSLIDQSSFVSSIDQKF